MRQLRLPKLLFLSAISVWGLNASAQCAGNYISAAGDIMITGYASDLGSVSASPATYRGFSAVLLRCWQAGQTIYFSDDNWSNTDSDFGNHVTTGVGTAAGESVFGFTPTFDIPVGTTVVVNFNQNLLAAPTDFRLTAYDAAPGGTDERTVASSAFNPTTNPQTSTDPVRILDQTGTHISGSYTIYNSRGGSSKNNQPYPAANAADNDNIYVFTTATGTPYEGPFTFLTAFANGTFDATSGDLPASLTVGVNAVSLNKTNDGSSTNGQDVAMYQGSTTCSGTVAACAALLANSASWTSENTASISDNTDGNTYDFPGSLKTAFDGSTFPVEWLSFTAEALAGTVSLDWATASETNNAFFSIEHSFDGNVYQEIGMQEGAGTTTEITTYSFVHNTPVIGTNFYRIRQVDINGKSSYSEIRQITVGNADRFVGSVAPNPALSGQAVSMDLYSLESAPALVKVADVTGRSVMEYSFSLEKGMNTVTLPTSQLAGGVYLVRVRMNGITYDAQRMIVQ